eukprot:s357_g46.t1
MVTKRTLFGHRQISDGDSSQTEALRTEGLVQHRSDLLQVPSSALATMPSVRQVSTNRKAMAENFFAVISASQNLFGSLVYATVSVGHKLFTHRNFYPQMLLHTKPLRTT